MTVPHLARFAWLSIGAAVLTIGIKGIAWLLTGSVGLLSDAGESVVNLVAGIIALIALQIAARPADWNHHYGHSKAEYFSAAIEGTMILMAAGIIIWAGIDRLLHPIQLLSVGTGLAISIIATLINGGVAIVLLRAGTKHRSITLKADGKHLLTDVWTSVGVVVGVGLVWLTGLSWLDPLVAFAVAGNIVYVGCKLIADSTAGLMDVSLPEKDNAVLQSILRNFESEEINFHAFRTREAGRRRFMEFHMLVPGDWTVQEAHTQLEYVLEALQKDFPEVWITAHLEPIEDPRSYENDLL